MIKKIITVVLLFCSLVMNAQDINTLLKEAINCEAKLNEPDALAKYKQILAINANSYTALEKAAILSCRIGVRTTDKAAKKTLIENGLQYAKRAFAVDSNNANSYYLMAMASGRMTDIEEDNKTKIAYVRDTKVFADKALAINPNHALANFVEGKWHYEMFTLNWAKKAAVKLLYGGLPEPNMEKCVEYLEKCKRLDPYCVINCLTLAQAYKEMDKTTKLIETLNILVKMPRRTFDDAAYIAEGKKMLEAEQ